MYTLVRSFLFLFDPESVHHFSMAALKTLCRFGWIKKILQHLFYPKHPTPVQLWGLTFKNQIGLAAGFDKNAAYLNELETLGFGHVEIGTVTPIAQNGNDLPRLFRLPKDNALINRMGFNNEGVDAVVARLKDWKIKHPINSTNRMIIGGNIGKNKVTPNEEAWKDYEICFRALHAYVDYFVVNVSSPNTPGLRDLQQKPALRKIFETLQTANKQFTTQKPLLLKIAPDLDTDTLNDIIDLALDLQLDGLVATNTTISRDNLITPKAEVEKMGIGGLSGLPVQKRSTEIVQYIHQKTNGSIPIIASGGIFTEKDKTDKLNAGAQLTQVWTGFVYVGPGIVKAIT
jgi:dihydroorotate dehydrogenase